MPAIFFFGGGGFSPVLEDSEILINTTKDVGVYLLWHEGPSPVKIEPDVYFQQNNTFNGGGGSRAETITWQ